MTERHLQQSGSMNSTTNTPPILHSSTRYSNRLSAPSLLTVGTMLQHANGTSDTAFRKVRHIHHKRHQETVERHQTPHRGRGLHCRHMRKFNVDSAFRISSSTSPALVTKQLDEKLSVVAAEAGRLTDQLDTLGRQKKAKTRQLLKDVTGWRAALADHQNTLRHGDEYVPCKPSRANTLAANRAKQERLLLGRANSLLHKMHDFSQQPSHRPPRTTHAALSDSDKTVLISRNIQSGRELKAALTSSSGVSIKDQPGSKVWKNREPMCERLESATVSGLSSTVEQHVQQHGIVQSLPAAYGVLDRLIHNMSEFLGTNNVADLSEEDLASLGRFEKVSEALVNQMDNREKYLTQDVYFKPCTATGRGKTPIFFDNDTQGQAIISLILDLAKTQEILADRHPDDFPQKSDGGGLLNHFLNATSSDASGNTQNNSIEATRLHDLALKLRQLDATINITTTSPTSAVDETSGNDAATPFVLSQWDEVCQETIHNIPIYQECYAAKNKTIPFAACGRGVDGHSSSLNQLWESTLDDTWLNAFIDTVLNHTDMVTAQNQSGCQPLRLINNLKSFVALELLRTSGAAFADALNGTSVNASASFHGIVDELGRDIDALYNRSTRVKRSDDPDFEKLVAQGIRNALKNFLDKMNAHPFGQGFYQFSNGYRSRVNEYVNKLKTLQSSSEMTETDQLLQNSAKFIAKREVFTSLRVRINESFRVGNYFEAGQRTYNLAVVMANQKLLREGSDTLQLSENAGADSVSTGSEVGISDSSLKWFIQEQITLAMMKTTQISSPMMYALVFSNPQFVTEALGMQASGYCMGYTLFQAVAGLGVDTLSKLEKGLMSYDTPGSQSIIQTIAAAQDWYSLVLEERLQTPTPGSIATLMKQLEHLGIKSGSAFFQTVKSQMQSLFTEWMALQKADLDISRLSLHLTNQFEKQKAEALAEGKTLNNVQLAINANYHIKVPHVMRLAIQQQADGTYSILFEDPAAKVIHLANLATVGGELTQPELEFEKLVRKHLQAEYQYEGNLLTLIKVTPDFLKQVSDLAVHPGTLLSIGEQATLSVVAQAHLENIRQLEAFTQFFTSIADKTLFDALKKPLSADFLVDDNKVSSSDSVVSQWRELESAIKAYELSEGTIPLSDQTISLAGSIMKLGTTVLSVWNALPDEQLKASLSAEMLTKLKALSASMSKFHPVSVLKLTVEERKMALMGGIHDFSLAAAKFHKKLTRIEALPEGSTTEWTKPTLTAQEETDLLAELLKQTRNIAKQQVPEGATPTISDLVRAEQQLTTTLLNVADVFITMTGSLTEGYALEDVEPNLYQAVGEQSMKEATLQVPGGAATVAPQRLVALLRNPEVRAYVAHKYWAQKQVISTLRPEHRAAAEANIPGVVIGGLVSAGATFGGPLLLTRQIVAGGESVWEAEKFSSLSEKEAADFIDEVVPEDIPDALQTPLEATVEAEVANPGSIQASIFQSRTQQLLTQSGPESEELTDMFNVYEPQFASANADEASALATEAGPDITDAATELGVDITVGAGEVTGEVAGEAGESLVEELAPEIGEAAVEGALECAIL